MKFNYKQEPGKKLNNRFKCPTDEPLVSIITPFYNAGEFFEQTYNSVMNQTFPWFEWIIVNDGSTSNLDLEILEEFSKRDERISVYNIRNGGAAGARNYGVSKSKSDLIMFLDADDLIDERYIEYLFISLKRNPDATWAYSDSVGFLKQEYLWKKQFSSDQMKKENILPYASIIKKHVFTEDKLYNDESKNMWEDYQLWLKMLEKRYYPVHIDQNLFWYRRHDGGELAKIDRNSELKKELQKKIGKMAKNVPSGIEAITFGGKRNVEFLKPEPWGWERKLPFAEKKIRILMMIPHMECGGADKFNIDVIKNVDKTKYEIGIITTVPAESEWRQEFQKYTDDIFELPSFLDMNDWAGFIHYYIKSRDVKIIWNISSYYGYYALPWLKVEFPEVAIIDCVHAEGKYWRAGGYPRVSATLDSIIERTYVTNDYTKNILVEKYGKSEENVKVIYTGIDENEFDIDTVDSSDILSLHGISENRPIVLFLCRMAAEKRPFMMLEIAKEVKKTINNICFLAVGGGPQIEELKAKSKQLNLEGTVYFTDRINDSKPYYKASDIFLLTSIKEGLSITTIEAMSMKLPVVSADVGSQYELVNDETGKLIRCYQDEEKDFDSRTFVQEEINQYCEAICGMLSDKAKLSIMGERCREKILNGFTLNTLVETLENDFENDLYIENVKRRKQISYESKRFMKIWMEIISMYIEYENVQLYYNGSNKIRQRIINAFKTKYGIISLFKMVYSERKNPKIKLYLKSFFR